ncbi:MULTISPECIES: methyl-accepting chemotaxis protein [Roseomonadaceae]|uniref:MCP four helix bundle domain-containing protein n=1 Tax=Falsiroseomonas oleicola TaxID=2801474 RepID=A0ABS6H412_9PROT|nr:methyl-accepting chemotaxis protein [Roseomonas oleicola]MBU8542758.1 MCP four helix bundle domain-containing protein [Roseomonas oleicola]
MLSRLSIRERLIAAFAFLLLCIAGLGGFGIFKMQAVNHASVEINENWLPSIQALARLRNAMNAIRIDIRNHTSTQEPSQLQAVEARLSATGGDLNMALRAYEALVSSPEERRLFDQTAAAIESYLREMPAMLAISRTENPIAATMAVNRVLSPIASVVTQRLEELTELNRAGAYDSTKAADATFHNARTLMLAGGGAAMLIGILVAVMLLRAINRGISDVVAPMQRLSQGDLTAEVPAIAERTEMGRIAAALRVFKTALEEKQRADAAIRQEEQAKARRAETVAKLVAGFEAEAEQALTGVAAATSQLDTMAGSMTKTARDGESRAASVAAAAEQASASVQNVAAAAEELGASIAEIARRVTDSATAARNAAEGARASDAAITSLSEAAQRIGDVVRLIANIAGQTNLLALNATIEAARAGEHGKGFAVVASEVKALAAQTASATEQISTQIAAMQAETRGAVDAIRGIAATIDQVDQITVQVAAAAEEQASATQEIVRAVAEAATGTREVSRFTGELSQGAVATGEAASQVGASSGELTQRSQRLRQQVDGFLSGIRAA